MSDVGFGLRLIGEVGDVVWVLYRYFFEVD